MSRHSTKTPTVIVNSASWVGTRIWGGAERADVGISSSGVTDGVLMDDVDGAASPVSKNHCRFKVKVFGP